MDMTALFFVLILTVSMDARSAEAPYASKQISDALNELGTTQYEVDSAFAPIRTIAELKEHLATNSRSPLYRLDSSARTTPLKSMVFTSHGLASYSFRPLQKLSISDAYAVLSLFGEQRAVGRIPGLRARTGIEESMLFVSRAGAHSTLGEGDPPLTPTEPLPHYACVVDGGSSPQTWCDPSPGAMCNPKCR